jgi:hypothetical protein
MSEGETAHVWPHEFSHVTWPLHTLQPQVGLVQPVQVCPAVQAQVGPQVAPEHPVQAPQVLAAVQLQAQLGAFVQTSHAEAASEHSPQPESPTKQAGPCGNTLIIKSVTLNVPITSSLGMTEVCNLYGRPDKITRDNVRLQGRLPTCSGSGSSDYRAWLSAPFPREEVA